MYFLWIFLQSCRTGKSPTSCWPSATMLVLLTPLTMLVPSLFLLVRPVCAPCALQVLCSFRSLLHCYTINEVFMITHLKQPPLVLPRLLTCLTSPHSMCHHLTRYMCAVWVPLLENNLLMDRDSVLSSVTFSAPHMAGAEWTDIIEWMDVYDSSWTAAQKNWYHTRRSSLYVSGYENICSTFWVFTLREESWKCWETFSDIFWKWVVTGWSLYMVIKIIAAMLAKLSSPTSLVKEMPMAALEQVTEEPLIWGQKKVKSQLQPRIVNTSCNEN